MAGRKKNDRDIFFNKNMGKYFYLAVSRPPCVSDDVVYISDTDQIRSLEYNYLNRFPDPESQYRWYIICSFSRIRTGYKM